MSIAVDSRLRFVALLMAGAILLPIAHIVSAQPEGAADVKVAKETKIPPPDEAVTAEGAADLTKTIAKKACEALESSELAPELLAALERDLPLALAPIMVGSFDDYHEFMTAAGLCLGEAADASFDEELEYATYPDAEIAQLRSASTVERIAYLWKRPEARGAAWEAISTESVLAKTGFNTAPWPRWKVVGGRMSIYQSPEGHWHRHTLASTEKAPVVSVRFTVRFTTSGPTWIDFMFVHQPLEGSDGGRWTPLWVFFAPPSGTWPRPLL